MDGFADPIACPVARGRGKVSRPRNICEFFFVKLLTKGKECDIIKKLSASKMFAGAAASRVCERVAKKSLQNLLTGRMGCGIIIESRREGDGIGH